MPTLKFTPPKIESVQSGKARARFAKIGELNKKGEQKTIIGVFYKDTGHREYEKFIRLQAIPQLKGFTPIVGPVETHFVFYFERPRSHYVNNDKTRPLKAGMPDRCTKTPDITDNACKGIADALTGLAWVDDKLITDHDAKKRWHCGKDEIHLTFQGVKE